MKKLREQRKMLNFEIMQWKKTNPFYVKNDVFVIGDSFDRFIKVSYKEYFNKQKCCVFFHGYTWQCCLKYTKQCLQYLQDQKMLSLIKSIFRGRISTVMGNRYVKSDEKRSYK